MFWGALSVFSSHVSHSFAGHFLLFALVCSATSNLNILKTTPTANKNGSYGIKVGFVSMPHKSEFIRHKSRVRTPYSPWKSLPFKGFSCHTTPYFMAYLGVFFANVGVGVVEIVFKIARSCCHLTLLRLRNFAIFRETKDTVRVSLHEHAFSQAPRKLLLVDFGRKEYGYLLEGGLKALQEPTLPVPHSNFLDYTTPFYFSGINECNHFTANYTLFNSGDWISVIPRKITPPVSCPY